MPQQLKDSITVPIYNRSEKTDCSNYIEISLLPTTYKILYNILVSTLIPYVDKITGDQLMIRYFAFVRYWRKKWEYNGTVNQLFIDSEVYDSARRELLHSILTEFEIPMKLIRLIKMCLNKTYSKVCIGKNLADEFPNQNA